MKGDVVKVTMAIGSSWTTASVRATKAGRTVRVKATGKYVDIEEMTAPSRSNTAGRQTGNRLRVAATMVVSIEEARHEPAALPRAKRTRAVPAPTLGLEPVHA